jgi:nucleotide-binding universal stress UspA family protein
MSHASHGPVLIGYDGYDEAAAAIRVAGRLLVSRTATVAYVWESLAARLLHSDVQGLTGTMREAADEFDAGEEARAHEVSAEGARLAGDGGFDAEPVVVRGKPKAWPSLLEIAGEREAAVIVVGTEGLGAVRSALVGSVSSGLLHHSRHPLLIVPRGAAEDAGGPVILAYDGSAHARRAIETAAEVLGEREAIVQTVWTSYRVMVSAADIGIPAAMATTGAQQLDHDLAARARETAEEGAAVAAKAGMRARAEAVLEHDRIYRTLLDSARDRDAAAVVVGSRGQSGVTAALIGSVAGGLVHHAHVPLLVVPPRD